MTELTFQKIKWFIGAVLISLILIRSWSLVLLFPEHQIKYTQYVHILLYYYTYDIYIWIKVSYQ